MIKNEYAFSFFYYKKKKMYKPKQTESKLLIYQKYVDLIEYAYKLLIKYPKYEKYALVNEIRRCMYSSLKYILYANKKIKEIFEKPIKM